MNTHQDSNPQNSREKDFPEHFFRELQIEFLIHELKDPISIVETGIRTLLQKKEKYGALSPRQERTLKRTLRNTLKAREMLYGLLEIGRSETGCFICCRFQPATAAYKVLVEALETMAASIAEAVGRCGKQNEALHFLNEHGIFLNITPQVFQMEMNQDETKFRQIVGNLIKNALHHRKERLEIKMQREKDRLVMDVIDDGPGIDPEFHQLIFKRYTQVNACSPLQRRGHGLGLAGARIMARCLGGDIELNSKKGQGAAFRLILPVSLTRSGS